MVCPQGVRCSSAKGEADADAEALRATLEELHGPAVGGRDLAHQLQPGAVGGPAVRLERAGRFGRRRGPRCRAAGHEQDDLRPLGPGAQTNGSSARRARPSGTW